MGNLITVGISDCKIAQDPSAVLVTYALGSCIGVSAYDPVAKVGGLLHVMLPDSAMETERGRNNPYMYADSGVASLLDEMVRKGASKRRLIVWLAGGAQVVNDNGVFNIGKRNHVSTRKALWKAGLFVQGECVGGELSRTVWLEIGSGRFLVREGGAPTREMTSTKLIGVL